MVQIANWLTTEPWSAVARKADTNRPQHRSRRNEAGVPALRRRDIEFARRSVSGRVPGQEACPRGTAGSNPAPSSGESGEIHARAVGSGRPAFRPPRLVSLFLRPRVYLISEFRGCG